MPLNFSFLMFSKFYSFIPRRIGEAREGTRKLLALPAVLNFVQANIAMIAGRVGKGVLSLKRRKKNKLVYHA